MKVLDEPHDPPELPISPIPEARLFRLSATIEGHNNLTRVHYLGRPDHPGYRAVIEMPIFSGTRVVKEVLTDRPPSLDAAIQAIQAAGDKVDTPLDDSELYFEGFNGASQTEQTAAGYASLHLYRAICDRINAADTIAPDSAVTVRGIGTRGGGDEWSVTWEDGPSCWPQNVREEGALDSSQSFRFNFSFDGPIFRRKELTEKAVEPEAEGEFTLRFVQRESPSDIPMADWWLGDQKSDAIFE